MAPSIAASTLAMRCMVPCIAASTLAGWGGGLDVQVLHRGAVAHQRDWVELGCTEGRARQAEAGMMLKW